MRFIVEKEAGRGARCGVAAGILLLAAEFLFSPLLRGAPLYLLQLKASFVLSAKALYVSPLWLVILVGLCVHFVLSWLFGSLYEALHKRMGVEWRPHYLRQAALGMLYGLAVYVLSYQLVGRLLYPWVLSVNQPVLVLLYAVAYGLPLALLLANGEQRSMRARGEVPVRG